MPPNDERPRPAPRQARQAKLDAKAKIKEQARTIPGQNGSPGGLPDNAFVPGALMQASAGKAKSVFEKSL